MNKPRDNDWITVSLTRTVFPPVCCQCGDFIAEYLPFPALAAELHLAPFLRVVGPESVTIHVPVCHACQVENRRTYRRTFWRAYLVAIAVSTALGAELGAIVSAALVPDANAIVPVSFCFAIVIGAFSLGYSLMIAKPMAVRASAPVRIAQYSPKNETVDVRFRRSGYGDLLVDATAGDWVHPRSCARK